MKEALSAALPESAVAPPSADTSIFCEFSDFDEFDDPARDMVAADDAEIEALAGYDAVLGHFSLPTLLRLTTAPNIATIVREPRARLLSAFMFVHLSRMIEMWGRYGQEAFSLPARSATAFFTVPRLARLTDNQICRLILHGDPRMRDGKFIASHDADGLAEAALTQLDRFGYVGVLEYDDVWTDMTRFFGVPLDPVRANVSGEGEMPEFPLPRAPFDAESVLAVMEPRVAADRIVYETLLERKCGARRAGQISEAAFAAQLIHFGDCMGTTATKPAEMRQVPDRD